MALENLDICNQLHERIVIIYMVDHYEAQLYTLDGDRKVLVGSGDDTQSALHDLNKQCEGKTWQDIRKLPETKL